MALDIMGERSVPVPPNSALQRAGTHKVLGRARLSAARPRADTLACRR